LANEKTVILICTLALATFIVASYISIQVDHMKGYSLSFGGNGDTTFENSNFMVTVDNHNERSKVLHIHGLSNTPFLANISSTYLSDQNGRISENVTFDGNSPKLTNLKIDRSTHPLNVVVNIQQGGIFQGRLILETANVTYSIPIVVTTKPLIVGCILIVIVGILLSITIWEIIKNSNKKIYNKQADELVPQQNMQNYQEFMNMDFRQRQTRVSAAAIIKARAETLENRYSNANDSSKQILLNIGSIVFGIAIGIFALPNNQYITGLRIIDGTAVIVLLGIGLGIGSLREFLEKI
jgi:hypothetical protein